MNSIFAKLKGILLYGTTSSLRVYEEAVLNAWCKHLSREAQSLLSAQLEHLVSYQRQAGDKLLAFFTLDRRSYPAVPREILFPCKLESCTVARIYLATADEKGTRLKAEVQLHKGRLISVEFNRPPGKEFSRGVQVAKVEILRDPMIPASEGSFPDAQRSEEALAGVQSKVPDEYLQMVREGKGVSINEWVVCAVQDIRKVMQRDGNYYLLAEKEDMGAVGVKEDESSAQVYYLDYGGDCGEKITVSLRKFFEEFDGGKVVGRY